jgi:L-threonylcarbamoyladenylate synthase
MSEVVTLDDGNTGEVRRRVAGLVAAGEVVVVPAETMYAVIADPFKADGTERLYAARGATRDRPLPVVIHNPRQLPALAEVPEAADRLMGAFWPGPLTLLVRTTEGLSWDLGESAGTAAVRMPAEPLLLMVLSDTGPLACTAAAAVGEPAPATIEEARASLGDAVALYVDAGPREPRPSTVVDVSRGGAEVRRAGPISADEVFSAVHADPAATAGADATPPSEPEATAD